VIDEFLAAARGSSAGLKVFFAIIEFLLIIGGIYIYRQREKLFGFRGKEGDTSAASNLRMIMIVLMWIHAVIITALMIYEV
jgi:hypothetical protein